MLGLDGLQSGHRQGRREQLVDAALPLVPAPRPGVAEPQLRQQVQRGGLGAVVGGRDDDADVLRPGLGVGDLHVEEAVLVEHAGVGELVLPLEPAAAGVLLAQLRVGVLGLRVAVEPLHPGVRRRAVDGPPVLLGVLAVVALLVGEAEQPLLEDGVLAVPHGDREVEEPEAVADPAQAVLTPPVGAGVRVVEGERGPGVAVLGVVLADGPPLAAGEVRAPGAPGRGHAAGLGEAGVLGGARCHVVGCGSVRWGVLGTGRVGARAERDAGCCGGHGPTVPRERRLPVTAGLHSVSHGVGGAPVPDVTGPSRPAARVRGRRRPAASGPPGPVGPAGARPGGRPGRPAGRRPRRRPATRSSRSG